MNSFEHIEHILETCLDKIAAGHASVEQCLAEYPEHRHELEPLLRAAAKLGNLRSVEPSADFRQRGRQALDAYMRANPRANRKPTFFAQFFGGTSTRRLATSLAAVLLALVSTGTVMAQGALPGDPLYGWKLQTEQLWRPFSGEKTQYELHLSERRAHEYVAVYEQPDLALNALEDYTESLIQVLTQLEMRPDQAVAVYESLLNQQKELTDSGIVVPELDAVLRTLRPTETDQPLNESSPDEQSGTSGDEGKENNSSEGGSSGLGNTAENQSLDNVLATSLPPLLQGVATAVAPILNP